MILNRTRPRTACLLGALLLSPVSHADVDTGFRVSLLPGYYESNGSVKTITSGTDTISLDDNHRILGVGAGATLLFDGWSAALNAEYLDVDSFDVTEASILASLPVSSTIDIFAGLRLATQGDGFFDDAAYTEKGPFIGASAATTVGKIGLNFSAAYNRSEFSFSRSKEAGGLEDGPANGFSVKAQFSNADYLNHAIGLRYRYFKFNSDKSFISEGFPIQAKVDFSESYLTAYYQYSF